MSSSLSTTDYDIIRKWVSDRGGHPATVRGTSEGGSAGLLRIDFDGEEAELKRIARDEFFKKFDDEKLTFLYQELTKDGKVSRFCKFVDDSEK